MQEWTTFQREPQSPLGGQEGPRDVTWRTATNPAWGLKRVFGCCGSASRSPLGKAEGTAPDDERRPFLPLHGVSPCVCIMLRACVRACVHLLVGRAVPLGVELGDCVL